MMKLFSSAFIFLSLLLPAPALAQETNTAVNQSLVVQGLGINPFLIELELASGQTESRTITLTNTTDGPLTFDASINDFVTVGKTGQPQFLPVNVESDPKYSLSRWLNITRQPQFTIPPLSKTEVTFTIDVPMDAEPGTHYGGILFGQPILETEGLGSAVQHKGGAVILVKLGQSQEKVQLTQFFAQQKIYQRGPVEFVVTLHNYGTVHSKAKGDITIRNLWGKFVTEVPVNPDANIVLPESERDFVQSWNNNLGFGRYTAETILYYGSPKLELRATTVFWILPVKELFLGVLILLILGIITYVSIRRYNQYIIKHSHDDL